MSTIKQLHDPKVHEFIEKRNALLKEKPELLELQQKIDDVLAGAGSSHNRMVLLKKMMMESVAELQKSLNELHSAVEKLKGNL